MKISARSVLMAGVATLTITATAAAPSVQALPREVAVRATDAASQQDPSQQQVDLLAAIQRLAPKAVVSPTVGQLAAPTAGLFAFPGLGNAIIGAYNAIEPWVAYGVDLADYALGWIPFGWLIGDQINIFYDSFEPAVQSIFYNIGWWVGGSISFGQGLNNVILDGANSFIRLLNSEIIYGFGFLPPLPPGFNIPQIPYLPWFGLLQAQTAATSAEALAPEVGVQNVASDLVNAIYVPVRNTIDYGVGVLQAALAPIPVVRIVGDQVSILWNSLAEPISNSVVFDLIDPVLNQPLNINSYINGAYAVGATTVSSLINTGIQEVNYFLGIPFSAQASTQARELDRTAEVGTVPSIVKNTLTGVRSVDFGATAGKTASQPGPLNEVRETVSDVRNVIREATGHSAVETAKAGDDTKTVGNEIVRTRHDVRGAITKAVDDVTGALGTGKPSKSVDGATKTSTNVVKSLGDTAKKVVKQVRQAAKDAHDAVGNRPSSDADE